jgi:hypothetical protein
MPEVYAELLTCVEKLERHFGDMQVRGLVCHVYIRLCIYFVLLLYISRSPLHSYWFLLHLERQWAICRSTSYYLGENEGELALGTSSLPLPLY